MRRCFGLLLILMGLGLMATAAYPEAQKGIMVWFGAEVKNPRFSIAPDSANIIITDEDGQQYPYLVRSPRHRIPSTIVQPTKLTDRDSLDLRVDAMRDRLLRSGQTQGAVAESMAAAYRQSAHVEAVRVDSGAVVIRYDDCPFETLRPVRLPEPVPPRALQLQRTIDDLEQSLSKGALVFIGWDNHPGIYAGRIKTACLQEMTDLRSGCKPQTSFLRPDLAELAAKPLTINQVKEGE